MGELWRRLQFLVLRGKRERELAEEMAFHQEMAERGGQGAFGNELRLREEGREAWGWTWLDRLGQDVRFALRLLRRSPGFTAAALAMLAVGIGVNVAAFGFFNLVLFRPLPVREPESLLRFHRMAPRNYSSDVPYGAYAFYREHTKTLSAMLALDFSRLTLEGAEKPLRADFVSANFFRELGARAQLGRLMDAARDERTDEAPVAVLGHEFWQRQFGSDPEVVGRTLKLNGKAVVVAGVVDDKFGGLTFASPDVWLPLAKQPFFVAGSPLLTTWGAEEDGVDVWGRMRPGVSARAVEEEMKALTIELRKAHPEEGWDGERLISEPGGYAQNAGGRDRATGRTPGLREKLRPVLGMTGALALLILAVACGNLGSLLLARGVARQREIQIRTSVGAGSGRLVRQLLTESVVLALAGAGAGLWLGTLLLHSVMRWSGAPPWLEVRPDWRVVTFTIGIGVTAALLFGLTPALQIGRQIARQKRGTLLTRKALIGVQVAASCVLLIVAGLLARGTRQVLDGDPGFAYERVIAIDPGLNGHGFSDAAARGYMATLTERLRGVAGVESLAMTATPPLGNRSSTVGGEKDGKQFPIFVHKVEGAYFGTMGIPVRRGRVFRDEERGVTMVSESLARRMWPGADPLTKQLEMGDAKLAVVGVTGNARSLALQDPDAVESYEPWTERDLGSMAVVVKLAGPVEGAVKEVALVARGVDSKVAPGVQTLKEALARKLDGSEKSALAASGLGLVALALACLGIAGVVGYEVTQRMKEIGIRMALGASQKDVVAAVARRFVMPVGLGLAAGAMGAAGLSQLLRRELYGVSPVDPLAYVGAMGLFALMAAAAVVWPARRAMQADPVQSLRQD